MGRKPFLFRLRTAQKTKSLFLHPQVEDSGTYVCEAVGYASYIPGQRVTVDLNVERCKYCRNPEMGRN